MYKRQHWNIANITPKDPVTLGLCAQRELDALVAAVARRAGLEASDDNRLGAGHDAMIAEPVSYTHLDVYKRQPSCCATASR